MIRFMVEAEIARPPAEVFAYVTDPSKLASWQTKRQFAKYCATLKQVLEDPTSRRTASTA